MPRPKAPEGYSTWTEYFEMKEPWKLEYWRYYSGRDDEAAGKRPQNTVKPDPSGNRVPRPKINCD